MRKNLYTKDGTQVKVGMIFKLPRREHPSVVKQHMDTATVRAIYHGPVGRVVLRWAEDGTDCEYFPSFIDAEWREEG